MTMAKTVRLPAMLLAGIVLAVLALAAFAAPSFADTTPSFSMTDGSTAQVNACTMDLVTYARANGGAASVVSAFTAGKLPASCYLISQTQFTTAAQAAYAQLPSTAGAEPPQVMACASDLVSYAKLHGGVQAAASALTKGMIPSCVGLTQSQQEAAAISAYVQFSSTAAPSTSASATPSMSASMATTTPAMTTTTSPAMTTTTTPPAMATAPAVGTTPTMAPATGGGTGPAGINIALAAAGSVIVLAGGAVFFLIRRRSRA